MTLWDFINLLKTHTMILKLRRCEIYLHKLSKEPIAYKSYSAYVLFSEWKFLKHKENISDLTIDQSFIDAIQILEKVNRRLKMDLQDWNINRRTLTQINSMSNSIIGNHPIFRVNDISIFRILDSNLVKSFVKQYGKMNYLSTRTISDIKLAPREPYISYSKTVFARLLAIWLKHDCKVMNNYNTWYFHRILHKSCIFRIIQACNCSITIDFHYSQGEYKTEVIDLRYSNVNTFYNDDISSIHVKFIYFLKHQGRSSRKPLSKTLKQVCIFRSNLNKSFMEDMIRNDEELKHIVFDDSPKPVYFNSRSC